ncbi:MAG: N-acetyl-D-Glu racemase DgcA [Vibrio sp.]
MPQDAPHQTQVLFQNHWICIEQVAWPIAGVFRISRGEKTHAQVLRVTLKAGEVVGIGESVPYPRYGESIESSLKQILEFVDYFNDISDSSPLPNQAQIQHYLPPSAARNALDCAWWDLHCKLSHQTIWQTLAIHPKPLTTAFTLSLDTPEAMKQVATANAHRPVLKLKLAGEGDLQRVVAVCQAAPKSKIIIDANEGWDIDQYKQLVPELAKLGVSLIEQPFPSDKNHWLDDLPRPIQICADESCHDSDGLRQLVGRFDVVNIKLDKTGGLTQALQLADKAKVMGFEIMVGCMVGSSLAMAPAFVVAQQASVVDLDGPLLLAQDCEHGFEFDGSLMHTFNPQLWG